MNKWIGIVVLIFVSILNYPINYGVGVAQDDSAAFLIDTLLYHLEVPIPIWLADYLYHLGHLLGVW